MIMETCPSSRAKIHEESLFDFESLVMAQPVPGGGFGGSWKPGLVSGWLLVGFIFGGLRSLKLT